MNRTIYIRDEDANVWEHAKELAKDSLSNLIVDYLRSYVASRSAEGTEYGRIVVRYRDSHDNDRPKAVAFYGKWVFPPEAPYIEEVDQGQYQYSIALTKKGKLAIVESFDCEAGVRERFFVFDSIDDAIENPRVRCAAVATLEKTGVPVQELDI